MKKDTIIMIIVIVLIIALIGAIGFAASKAIKKLTYKPENPVATITFEGYDEPIVVELYPEYAPNTVKNFITLAQNGFYNGLKIHRVEEYVIQGGDPNGNGSGGPTLSAVDKSIAEDSDADKEYTIVGEFKANGYDNPIVHEKGVISMARTSYGTAELATEGYNSAGSQFFICTKYMQAWNGQYAAFGKMTSGWDTLDKISNVELKVEKNEETGVETKTSTPAQDVIISSITVDTKGVEYGAPSTLEPFNYYNWYFSRMYGGQY